MPETKNLTLVCEAMLQYRFAEMVRACYIDWKQLKHHDRRAENARHRAGARMRLRGSGKQREAAGKQRGGGEDQQVGVPGNNSHRWSKVDPWTDL